MQPKEVKKEWSLRSADVSESTVEKIINYTVPEGTVLSEEYLYSLCESAGYYPDFGFDGEAVGKTAQANETYTVDAKL